MSNRSLIALIAAVVLAIVAWNSFYIVAQTEKAVLLQFGRIVQADVQPGLHVKYPYINQVRKSFFEELGIYDNETFIRQVIPGILNRKDKIRDNYRLTEHVRVVRWKYRK